MSIFGDAIAAAAIQPAIIIARGNP